MLNYEGYIFDLDGTIYLGPHAIEGAPETVNKLLSDGKQVLFLTNKTIDSRENYVTKLNGLGIPVTLAHILNPAVVTINMLQERYDGLGVYVIGEQIFKDELLRAGIRFAKTPEETSIIVVSWDREFHYDQLNFAYQALKLGADIMATNPDRTCPMPGGDVPDCGSMIGAIEGATGRRIDCIAGKPSREMAEVALRTLGLQADECLMIGDRLETDIYMGKESGLHTALVLTGAATAEEAETASHKPNYVLDSVKDLIS